MLLIVGLHGSTMAQETATPINVYRELIQVDRGGRCLALVEREKTDEVHVWDLATGKTTATLKPQQGDEIVCLHFSRDGSLLATGTRAGRVSLFAIPSGNAKATGYTTDGISALWIAPDGSAVAAKDAQGKSVTIWNTDSGKVAATIAPDDADLKLCTFSQDGSRFTAVFRDQVWQWSRSEQKAVRKLGDEKNLDVRRATAADDGQRIAAVTPAGVEVWQTSAIERVRPLEYDSSAEPRFTPDGRRLLCLRRASNGFDMDVWGLGDGSPRFIRTISGAVADKLAFLPDAHKVAFPVVDGSVIRLADFDDAESQDLGRPNQFGTSTTYHQFAFAPDGKTMITADGPNLRVWDVATGVVTGQIKAERSVERFWLGCDGGTVAALDSGSELTLCKLGESLAPVPHRTFEYATSAGYPLGFRKLDFRPDGRTLAVALRSSAKVALIDTNSGKELETLKYPVVLMGFNRIGDKLLLLSSKKTSIFDSNLRTVTDVRGTDGSFSQGPERLVWGLSDDKPAVWNPSTGKIVQRFETRSVLFRGLKDLSPDGTKLVVMGKKRTGDGPGVEVIDLPTGRSVSYVPLYIDSWLSVKFSPDGSQILIATSYTVEFVDYRTRQVVRQIDFRPPPPERSDNDDSGRNNSSGSSAGSTTTESAYDQISSGGESDRRQVHGMDVSSTGIIAIATPEHQVKLWDLQSGVKLHTIDNPRPKRLSSRIENLAFSDDGRLLAYTLEKDVHLVDVSQVIRRKSPTTNDSENDSSDKPKGSETPVEPEQAASATGDTDQGKVEPEADPLVRAKAKVVDTLIPLLKDEDPVVRQLAEEMIRKLKPSDQ